MEVHHHPDLHHKDKHFKDYFFEFLMIFLAVSLGFIAENLREHFTDRSKEKEYISGIIRNLETDTASFRYVIAFDRKQVNGIDSFLQLAHAPMLLNSNRKKFYNFLIKYFFNSATFTSEDITLQQLKNTGDYRLITQDHVADSLAGYEADIQNIYAEGDYYKAYFKDIVSRLDEITDMTIFDDTSYLKYGEIAGKEWPLLNDTNKLRVLFNKAFDFRIITSSYAEGMLVPELKKATALIAFLKKEYDIS